MRWYEWKWWRFAKGPKGRGLVYDGDGLWTYVGFKIWWLKDRTWIK